MCRATPLTGGVIISLMGVVLALVACFLVSGLVAYLLIRRAVRRGIDQMASFFAPNGDQPSQFALVVQMASKMVAAEMTSSIKASLMGQASGISRALSGIQADAVGDAVAAQNPLAGLALEAFPSLKKRLGKMDPQLVMGLAQMFSKATAGGGKAQPGKNGSGARPPGEQMTLGVP